jgi:hypothetical protein
MSLMPGILQGMPAVPQECAEAIERLPHLKALGLGYVVCEEGAYWGAMSQQRMHGRCKVQAAPSHIIRFSHAGYGSVFRFWSNEDW